MRPGSRQRQLSGHGAGCCPQTSVQCDPQEPLLCGVPIAKELAQGQVLSSFWSWLLLACPFQAAEDRCWEALPFLLPMSLLLSLWPPSQVVPAPPGTCLPPGCSVKFQAWRAEVSSRFLSICCGRYSFEYSPPICFSCSRSPRDWISMALARRHSLCSSCVSAWTWDRRL